jgi:outer membrane lipoprotein-sorting protein
MKKYLIIVLVCTQYSIHAKGVNAILQEIDKRMSQISDFSAKVALTQQKVGQGVKNFETLFFRRDEGDEFLMVTTAPQSEKGNGYLRTGNNFWMYRQNTRTFQHINRDESINGTDTKAGDFERKKTTELYKPYLDASGKEDITEEMLGNKKVWKFTVVAKVRDVTYPKQVYWVEQSTYLQLKVQSYSLSGTLMQTAYFIKYTQIEGKYILLKGMFVDEFEKGNKTVLEISGVSLKKLDPKIFTKAYLENLSK